MKVGKKSIGTLLILSLMSWLMRLFAGNLAMAGSVRELCSVTWNS